MCSASGDDGFTCDVWAESHVRARKEYWCDACSGPIKVGDKYLNNRSLFDGHWTHERMCVPCEKARDRFKSEHDEALIPLPSSLTETLEECIEYGDASSARRWRPTLRAMAERRKLFARAAIAKAVPSAR